jgi:acyl-CoA reductase-like NAD-dependent aldehyde dehydrogenase/nicotinamidase-related amidase
MKPVLILIDLQNDFLQTPSLAPASGEVIDRAAALLNGCRSLGIPVIHVWTTINQNDDRRMPHWKRLNKWACVEGTEGHRTPEPLCPIKSEKIIHKTFFSAFENVKLDEVLNSMDFDSILIAGMHLHGCVRATILDAYQRGFTIWVAEDAVSDDDPLHASITRRYLEERAARFATVDYLLSLMYQENSKPLEDMPSGPPSLPAMVISNREISGDLLNSFVHISPRQSNNRLWSVPICKDEQISQATIEAQQAYLNWKDTAITSRVELFNRLSDLLERESRPLAEQMAIEIGKPIIYGEAEMSRGVALLKAAARHVDDIAQGACNNEGAVRYRPLGVIAIVTPWNNSVAIPLGKIAPALLYGNVVVWKPAPAASSVAVKIMGLLRLAGCPPGVVNLVCGDRSTAEALMSDKNINGVSLTGSLVAGYSAQYICALRHIPLQAELGGNNASIVWSDCDLEKAALRIAEAAFGSAGQRCTANRRVIVESQCYDIFIKYLKTSVSALAWGDPLDHKTKVGPMISHDMRNRLIAVVSRAQSEAEAVLVPHEVDPNYAELIRMGAYYPPTIICCNNPDNEIVQEETFGPVLVIQKAPTLDHAIGLCNGVKQGLVAALFSQSKEIQAKFLDEAQAGILKINSPTADAGVECPFGGWKASGIGPPEHGPSDREFYTRTQSVYRREFE